MRRQQHAFQFEGVGQALLIGAADADQSLSLNYVGLIAPMVTSIQERQAQLQDNQKKIDALRARLTKP